jgi:hypothetical protein
VRQPVRLQVRQVVEVGQGIAHLAAELAAPQRPVVGGAAGTI